MRRPSMPTRTTLRPSTPEPKQHWYDAGEDEVHGEIFAYVELVERQQFDTYNRFHVLEVLYDPNAISAPGAGQGTTETPGLVIENVIASNVDTVTASVAATDVRARFMTDDGGWTVRRTARRLEWYAEELGKKLKIPEACQKAFKSAAKKGTGVVKAYVNQFGEPQVEPVRIDDIIVDEAECRNGGTPRQMHRRMTNVDRGELQAMFPKHAKAIGLAQTGRNKRDVWAGYRPILGDELVVIESHKLPVGRKGKPGYRPGRHTICVDGCTLLDEKWTKPHFPYACIVWSEREGAFFGISLSEGIAGIQRALNKRNLQIDRHLDQYAFPTTYVNQADANLAVKTINRIGQIAVVKGDPPKTITPTAVSPEVYAHRDSLKSAAYENSGISRMAAQAVKPPGIDSGVAMREYRDQTTQRFAMQEKAFEKLVLDVYWLVLDCCKDLGDAAPAVTRKGRFGTRKIKWADVDMGDVTVQIAAASTLSRTPAGRYQTALEWAQAGLISADEWRRLSEHPDLDRVLSLYTQGMESIEEDIEAIEEGYAVQPEPFGNLALMVRMAQMAYLRDRNVGDDDGEHSAPEEVLEGLRQYAVMAAHMLTLPAKANQAPGEQIPAGPPGAGAGMPLSPSMMAPAGMPGAGPAAMLAG
jgi:hypothetical protein